MFEYLELAIDSAVNSGAKYSDARILISKSRNIAAKNGEVENFNESENLLTRVLWANLVIKGEQANNFSIFVAP